MASLKKKRDKLKQTILGIFEPSGSRWVYPDTVIYFDGWRNYNELVDVGYAKFSRVYHDKNQFVHSYCHINAFGHLLS